MMIKINLKLLLTLTLSIFLYGNVLSQDRVNSYENNYRVVNSYSKISKCSWYYFDGGVWNSTSNRYIGLNGPRMDFTHSRIIQIEVNEKIYDVMIVGSIESGYKYPNIKEGYFSIEMTHYFVFDSLVYKLKKMESGETKDINCDILFWEYGGISSWDKKEEISVISKGIKKYQESGNSLSSKTNGFMAWIHKDEVRFWMPDRKPGGSKKIISGDSFKKEECYYAMPIKSFFKFIKF